MAANLLPPLPDDLAQCHRIIADLQSHVTELAATLEEEQRLRTRFQHQVEMLLKRLYGPRAERIDPAQLVFFGEETAAAPAPEEVATEDEAPAPKPVKKGHGRKPLPKDLPRKRLVHDVPETEKTCPECATPKRRIGEEVREQIEYVPASLYILEHVYPKYACTCCQEHVSVAKAAPRVIEKGCCSIITAFMR
jgi:transposase